MMTYVPRELMSKKSFISACQLLVLNQKLFAIIRRNFLDQWKRIHSLRELPLVLDDDETIIEKEISFFLKKIIDEITQDHRSYSLAKITIETRLSLNEVKDLFLEKSCQISIDKIVNLLTLHRNFRTDFYI